MNRHLIFVTLLSLCSLCASAQSFSIATLNVDGLPQSILTQTVNPDGPGMEGTKRISRYLAAKDYDMVCVQEDFNYHSELTTDLVGGNTFDEHSGGISIADYDFGDPEFRFKCDGLGALWRTSISVIPAGRTAWHDYNGRTDHAWDGMVTKGWRRYAVTIADGIHLTVYNLHMDASDDSDVANDADEGDRMARQSQWQQLREDIVERIGDSPIIVVGDFNSLYARDNIDDTFIDYIESHCNAVVTDVWHEIGEGSETLDKIFCINPSAPGTQLIATAYTCDRTGYSYDGKPLGDHYPVSAVFEVNHSSTVSSPKEHSSMSLQTSLYNIAGQRISTPLRGNIYVSKERKLLVK